MVVAVDVVFVGSTGSAGGGGSDVCIDIICIWTSDPVLWPHRCTK